MVDRVPETSAALSYFILLIFFLWDFPVESFADVYKVPVKVSLRQGHT